MLPTENMVGRNDEFTRRMICGDDNASTSSDASTNTRQGQHGGGGLMQICAQGELNDLQENSVNLLQSGSKRKVIIF
jgi:hypothetical protein